MNKELQTGRALIVEDAASAASTSMNGAVSRLAKELASKNITTVRIQSGPDAFAVVSNDMDFDCFLVSTDMDFDPCSEHRTAALLKQIRTRQPDVPVFLLADREKTSRKLNSGIMELASEFV